MGETNNRILLGQIGAAHGIKGEVRIASHTEVPEAIASYGPLDTDKPGVQVTITAVRHSKNVVVATLKGVTDRNGAEALNGTKLFVDRARLPELADEDDFYHADLIGLEARLDTGVVLGQVTAIPNYGAGDLVEITDEQTGDTFLYPFTKAVVPEISLVEGFLTIIAPTDADAGEEEPD